MILRRLKPEVEAGDQEFNAVLLQRELGASLDHSLQNKKGTVFKGVTVLTLAKATQVPVSSPHPASSLRPRLTYHD